MQLQSSSSTGTVAKGTVVNRNVTGPRRLAWGLLASCWLMSAACPQSIAQFTLEPIDLETLTDQELVDLYAATYHETLRDSIVDDSSLVDPGRSLLQLGYSYTTQSKSGGRYSTHTVPEFLIRHRLTRQIEVRRNWGGVTFDRLYDELTGISDRDSYVLNPSIGMRLLLLTQHGAVPQTSITASTPVDFQTGSGILSRLSPQISAGYSWLLGDQWLLTGSTGAVWIRDLDIMGVEDRFLDLQQSLSLDWLITDRASFYLQWMALFPEGARIDGIGHSLGPGLSLPLGKKTQLDIVTGFGIDDDSPDFGIQTFLSWQH